MFPGSTTRLLAPILAPSLHASPSQVALYLRYDFRSAPRTHYSRTLNTGTLPSASTDGVSASPWRDFFSSILAPAWYPPLS